MKNLCLAARQDSVPEDCQPTIIHVSQNTSLSHILLHARLTKRGAQTVQLVGAYGMVGELRWALGGVHYMYHR